MNRAGSVNAIVEQEPWTLSIESRIRKPRMASEGFLRGRSAIRRLAEGA